MVKTIDNILQIKDMHKYYHGSVHILKGINLEIRRGRQVSIIGRSGCGKTTLLRCLAALELFDAGEIEIAGVKLEKRSTEASVKNAGSRSASFMHPFQEVERLEQSDDDFRERVRTLRSRVGIVFQSLNLFPHLSVLENVAKAPIVVKQLPKKQARDLAAQLLEKVGLAAHLQKMPHQISGGQAQRVAIARALALQPEIILYDEPTSSLDPELVHEFITVMNDLKNDGITQIVVTHSMSFTRKASELVAYMEEGRIVEVGRPDEIFKSPKDNRTKQYLKSYIE